MNFWDNHGVVFLICIACCPRLTMLFATAAGGGLFYWLGWVFCPRIVVAILATIHYWDTNPVLVVCSYLIAMAGESAEKSAATSTTTSS